MKLGLMWGYWGAGPPPDVIPVTQEAERLGFDSVWTAEAWGSDAFSPLAWIAGQTSTIKLGTGVVQLSARTPTATAMAAMTIDHISNGRFQLGLGVSGPQVVEGWYGMPFPKPLARTREYVSIIRDVLARQFRFRAIRVKQLRAESRRRNILHREWQAITASRSRSFIKLGIFSTRTIFRRTRSTRTSTALLSGSPSPP